MEWISLFSKQPKPILLITCNFEPEDIYRRLKKSSVYRGIKRDYHILYLQNKKTRTPRFEVLSVKTREIDGTEIISAFLPIMNDIIKHLPEPTKKPK